MQDIPSRNCAFRSGQENLHRPYLCVIIRLRRCHVRKSTADRRSHLSLTMEIDTIREHFARPPAEFGPTPFWFLNDELDEDRLRFALEEMKSKGIAGVVIHPRTGRIHTSFNISFNRASGHIGRTDYGKTVLFLIA